MRLPEVVTRLRELAIDLGRGELSDWRTKSDAVHPDNGHLPPRCQ